MSVTETGDVLVNAKQAFFNAHQSQFDRHFVIAGCVVALVVLGEAVWGIRQAWFLNVDFLVWKGDWGRLLDCIEKGAIGRCELSKFPSAYLLNAAAVGLSGQAKSAQLILLGLNLLFLAMPLFVLTLLNQEKIGMKRAAVAYVGAIALSPLPSFYIYSGALEVQSGVVSGLFISGCWLWLRRRHGAIPVASKILLCASAFAFPLYKDTVAVQMFVTAVASWLLLLLWRQRWLFVDNEKIKSALAFVGVPLLLSIALAVTLNCIRYGVPLPMAYIAEAAATSPPLRVSVQFLFGSLLSPNGGVLIFWSLSLTSAIFLLRWLGGRLAPAALLTALIFAVLAMLSFSLWWSPFGWDAWGDRLMVAPMLSLLVVAVLTTEFDKPKPMGTRSAWIALALAPVLLCSGYYVGLPYVSHDGNRGALVASTVVVGSACAGIFERVNQRGESPWRSELYYACARDRLLYVPR